MSDELILKKAKRALELIDSGAHGTGDELKELFQWLIQKGHLQNMNSFEEIRWHLVNLIKRLELVEKQIKDHERPN